MLYGPRDVRLEERPDPAIIEQTDAILRISAACVCGSDLWSYRGIEPITQPTPMGHEYVGIVEEVGSEVTSSPASSSSARSGLRTTPARSARRATRAGA
jgi:threonine dehydrogenase-like Zn-dependent dehydrogenase